MRVWDENGSLLHTVSHCSTLKYTVIHCNTCGRVGLMWTGCCNALALQHTATHCNYCMTRACDMIRSQIFKRNGFLSLSVLWICGCVYTQSTWVPGMTLRIGGKWAVDVCDMTHIYVWYDSLTTRGSAIYKWVEVIRVASLTSRCASYDVCMYTHITRRICECMFTDSCMYTHIEHDSLDPTQTTTWGIVCCMHVYTLNKQYLNVCIQIHKCMHTKHTSVIKYEKCTCARTTSRKWICIYIYIYLYIYIYIYIYIHIHIYMSIYLSISLSIYLSINQSIYLSMYMSIYIHMYVCVFCIHAYKHYVYIHVHRCVGLQHPWKYGIVLLRIVVLWHMYT